MKVWRAEFGVDNGYSGSGYVYATNKRTALREAKAQHDDQFDHVEVIATRVDIPTDRRGLVKYLNKWHSQADI